jgi:hypothetical protein
MIASLAPMRLRYHELMDSPDELYAIAERGAHKASEVSGPIYRRAAHAMGLL